MVQVQQHVGCHDCGLFACVFVELLSYHHDPSQFSFDQASLRETYGKFLINDSFDGFKSLKNIQSQTSAPVYLNWGFKAGEKSAAYGKRMAAQNQNDEIFYTIL